MPCLPSCSCSSSWLADLGQSFPFESEKSLSPLQTWEDVPGAISCGFEVLADLSKERVFIWEFCGHLPQINFSLCFLNKISFLAATLPIPWCPINCGHGHGHGRGEEQPSLQPWPGARAPRTPPPVCCSCWVYGSFSTSLKVCISSQSGPRAAP